MKFFMFCLLVCFIFAGCGDNRTSLPNETTEHQGSQNGETQKTAEPEQPAGPKKSLYERVGGEKGVDAVVRIFYEKVRADERVKEFFFNISMERQIRKQKEFLTMAFGGPSNYTGESLRAVHRSLRERGVNDSHFDAIKELLKETMVEVKLNQQDVEEALNIVEGYRNDVLNK